MDLIISKLELKFSKFFVQEGLVVLLLTKIVIAQLTVEVIQYVPL